MKRTTIDFGIDLGTTNSAVAVLNDKNVEIIKNNDGEVLTPSVVWINKKENLYVGKRAKNHIELDPENTYAEFKLQMGTDTIFDFKDSGKSFRAEDLSAEILKSLKADVKHMLGEEINAVVITVPAAFELPQIEATNKAAELAGFTNSPLLQEPIAAALAYGFQSKSDKVFWLVYDFGGGTFDAAVMQVKEGEITVVNHMGDNHLGGKLIDWEVVDKIFTPELLNIYSLSDFKRGNPKWRGAFAKLKKAAEEAKIRLSRTDSEEILALALGQDDAGVEMELDLVLKRSKLEELARPFIVRSANMCKKALSDKKLSPKDIEKVILVGGTTLIPYVREVLSDPKEGLGIPLDFSIDPLTVVAQGAAIFAGAQQLKVDLGSVSSHQYILELDYDSVGTDKMLDVVGKIAHSTEMDFNGFSIEFIEQGREKWRSGKIPIGEDGSFFAELRAFEGRKNTYLIELLDGQGIPQETVPQSISYTFGMTISAPPLVHSIGVALANNEVDFFFEKGASLPCRLTKGFKTAYEARSGEGKPVIKIPIIEGENKKRADRNIPVGYLNIPGNKISRTLTAGSEVEVTIDINESRIIKAAAFFPDLAIEIEEVIRLGKETQDVESQKEEFEREKQRYFRIRENAETIDDPALEEALGRIEEENMLEDLENALERGGQDKDTPDKIQKRLTELKQAIDEVEEKSKWPLLLEEVEEERGLAESVVNEYGSGVHKRHFQDLDREIQNHISSGNRDADDLRKKLDELRSLRFSILHEQPGYWVAVFNNLKENPQMFPDTQKATLLFRKGEAAIKNNNVGELQEAVRALFELLPLEQQQAMPGGLGSSIIL